MPQEEITPTSNEEYRRRMRALESAPINNGPLVYELTDQASKNGIDPFCYSKDGICIGGEQ